MRIPSLRSIAARSLGPLWPNAPVEAAAPIDAPGARPRLAAGGGSDTASGPRFVRQAVPEPSTPKLAGPAAADATDAGGAAEAARARGRAAAQQRTSEVFTHPDCVGKERAAAQLLTESDMPADKIIAMLPNLAANPGAPASMLAVLAAQTNPDMRTR